MFQLRPSDPLMISSSSPGEQCSNNPMLLFLFMGASGTLLLLTHSQSGYHVKDLLKPGPHLKMMQTQIDNLFQVQIWKMTQFKGKSKN